jgi:CHAD domain
MVKAEKIPNLDAQAPTGQNARIIARKRLDEMFSWEASVDNAYAVSDLHNFRIAAKRLRYTLEIFAETFSDESAAIIKEVEQIQEELGILHDSDVMIALLRLCLLQYPQTDRSKSQNFVPLLMQPSISNATRNVPNTSSDFALGGQDSGSGYEQVLSAVAQQHGQGDFPVNPVLLAHVLVPGREPDAEERQGLEELLRHLQAQRDSQYRAFRQHWYQLKARDFRHEVLALLAS